MASIRLERLILAGLDKTRIKAFLRGGDSEEIPIFVEEYLENAGDACQNSLIFRQYIVMDMYVAAEPFFGAAWRFRGVFQKGAV